MLGDIIYLFSFHLKQSSCYLFVKHITVFSDLGGRGHYKSYWLPWLQNGKMQNHNNTLLELRTLSGKSEPNLECLPQRMFDKQPFELLGTFEMEANFTSTAIYISKILFETSQ